MAILRDFNLKTRVYWCSTVLLGIVALTYAVTRVNELPQSSILGVVVSMAVVYIVGLRAIGIAGTKTSITPGDIFVFLALLFWGVPAAMLVGVTDAAAASFRTSRRWTSRFGSPAMIAISIFISGFAFTRLNDWMREVGMLQTSALLLAVLLFSLIHFFLNSALLTAYLALKTGVPVLKSWWENYAWASLPFAASSSAAGLIYLSMAEHGLSALLAAGPLVAIIFATCNLQFKRADERARAAEAQARDAEAHMRELQASEERFRSAFNHAPIGMALASHGGKWVQVNRALCSVLGYSESDLLGDDFRVIIHDDDRVNANRLFDDLLEERVNVAGLEQRFIHRTGREIWTNVSISNVRDPHDQLPRLIFQIEDITDRRRVEQLAHTASHDSLTGVANRSLFMDKLKAALKTTQRRRNDMFAILFIDLDHFKSINDRLGHQAGDELLIDIAKRLQASARPNDTVARLGGDEFTILLQDIHHREEAISVSERIQKSLTEPFVTKGSAITVTASIGIALSSDGYESVESILCKADTAMYAAKSKGGAMNSLFDPLVAGKEKEVPSRHVIESSPTTNEMSLNARESVMEPDRVLSRAKFAGADVTSRET